MGRTQTNQLLLKQSTYQQDFMTLTLMKGDMHLPQTGWPASYGCMLRCTPPLDPCTWYPTREKPFHKRPSIIKSYNEKSNKINWMEHWHANRYKNIDKFVYQHVKLSIYHMNKIECYNTMITYNDHYCNWVLGPSFNLQLDPTLAWQNPR